MNIRNILGLAGAALALSIGFVAASLASDGRMPVPTNAVTTGEIVVGESPGHIQGTTTPAISGSLTLGASGTAITQIRVWSATHSPAANSEVTANSCSEVALTVTGVAAGDNLLATYVPVLSGAVAPAGARASGTDAVALRFCNVSGSDASTPGGVYTITGFRS